MINLQKITEENRSSFEKIFGILPIQTHVLRAGWEVYTSSDATPVEGWEQCEAYQDFQGLVELTRGERVLVMSGEELYALTGGQGPLAPRGPGLTRGYGFAVVTVKKTANAIQTSATIAAE